LNLEKQSIGVHAHRFTFSSIGLAETQVKLPALHACQGRNPHKSHKKSLYSCSGDVHFGASITPCRHDIGEADPPSALHTEMFQVKTYPEEPLSQTDINLDLDCLKDHELNQRPFQHKKTFLLQE